MRRVNIIISVDVIAALSNQKLDGSINMMDNSLFDSIGQGTPNLSTHCCPGDCIIWEVKAIDLQTPVLIRGIEFLREAEKDAPSEAINYESSSTIPLLNKVWEGYVPYHLIPNKKYYYRLEVQMSEGKYSTMCITSPSIQIVNPA